MINLPQNQVDVLDALVDRGMSPTRNALIQQILSAFMMDLKNQQPKQNPNFLESALGALAGAFLFGLGVAILSDIFGGEK
ncbi:MAG: hypothetical protein P1Q69_10930 [Candidatus Thorarchaeota archaeon]|nr:hypothetical protein [Candidatus Thorarchaeota archaeon]